jgi:hypothetical protein
MYVISGWLTAEDDYPGAIVKKGRRGSARVRRCPVIWSYGIGALVNRTELHDKGQL